MNHIATIILCFIPFIDAFICPLYKFSNHPRTLLYSQNNDLLVFGASVTGIGGRIIHIHRRQFPNSTILGVTQTTKNHDFLSRLNCIPILYDNLDSNISFPNVIIAVPPNSRFDDRNNKEYSSIIEKSCSLWNKNGKLIFSSSGSVYTEKNGNFVSENSNIDTTHALYVCENMVRSKGGTVLRFGALYGMHRGDFWRLLDNTQFNISENLIVEMCNYDDAASAIATILYTNNTDIIGETYNVCDGKGKTIKEILGNCIRVHEYRDKNIPILMNSTTYTGKRYNITKIKDLGWRPRWRSFEEWCRAHSYAPNPVSNEIKLYKERKILEKEELQRQYDIKLQQDNNVEREGALAIVQFLAFFIAEIYLFYLPKK